ncbi:MAG: hypothetical protein E7676_03430 [Ruminococcaceae bacterium]|nr:hypothetical protein [Oscillospiraceae bacterium]
MAADEAATQAAVDAAAAALSAARGALAIRPIEEVEGGNKSFRIISGDSKEITLSDYVNVNGLSKITYAISANNAVVELSEIVDGKFTISADEVREETPVTVSIVVSYDGTAKLEIELAVKITNDIAPVLKNESVSNDIDIFDLENKESYVIDFGANIDNAGNLELTYSAKCGEEDLTLNGALYTLALGDYSDEYAYQVFTITVSYEANGVAGTIEYTYNLGIRDTGAYRVAGGNFENGIADGWTASESFGGVDDRATFWDQAFPMFNVGKYFTSEGRGNGSLASPYFVVNSQYATYMIGAAGKQKVYITIENEAGEVVALYRNTKFADFPAGVEATREMVGDTVFVCNFVTYKVDISAFQEQKIRFVIHDYEEDGGFGFVYFDELKTYYGSDEQLPEGAVLAENLLADKAALNAELALEITAQGDYTEASYNAYLEKLAAAKALADDIAATAADVNAATEALTNARLALAVRPVLEVEGANKSFKLFSGNNQEIVIADYINENGLSKITYAVQANSAIAVLSDIADGKFTITAGDVNEATDVTVSIIVNYDGEKVYSLDLSVEITNDLAPTVKNGEVVKSFDLYLLENKASTTLDLSENVDNAGELALSYAVNGVAADALYTFTFGDSYNSNVTYETLTVTVSYVANGVAGSIEYTYKLAIVDSTEYRLENGGFENGLDGWTVVGNIGAVSSDTHYWINDPDSAEGYAFGMDGEKMFSAYATNDEAACGTLTSSPFVVSTNRVITFKLGAAKHDVFVEIVDATTGKIYARYGNSAWRANKDAACALHAYKAVLPEEAEGKTVYIRIVDNATGDYGLFFCDSFITYYDEVPTDGFVDAIDCKHQVANGSFETGNLYGWTNDGEIGVVTNSGAWDNGLSYEKNGEYLFTGTASLNADTMREGNRGSLTSSVFEIGGIGYISFMLGGGDNDLCYVQVIDAATGEVLARYHQQMKEGNPVLKTYVADLSAYIGRSVRFQVVDQADRDWGCVSFDNLVTYYANAESLPAGITANDVKSSLKYTIENGSFETGNLDGWTMNVTEAGAQNTLGWVESSEHDADWYTKNDGIKDGDMIFTFCRPDGINCENSKGTLQSSTFSLKQGAFVAFKFGGAGGAANQPLVIDTVCVQLCRADGSVIATFLNDAEGKINTKMNAYCYQYNGPEVNCFFRVVDNATGNYGCFVVDDFRVNLDSKPEGFIQK